MLRQRRCRQIVTVGRGHREGLGNGGRVGAVGICRERAARRVIGLDALDRGDQLFELAVRRVLADALFRDDAMDGAFGGLVDLHAEIRVVGISFLQSTPDTRFNRAGQITPPFVNRSKARPKTTSTGRAE